MFDSFTDPIHVFLDTEFTKLHILEKKLISVGFYAEFSTDAENKTSTSEIFYMELTDTYTKKDCSDFVKKEVLPHLSNAPKHQGTQHEMIMSFFNRIEDMPRDVVLVSDAPSWDFSFFTEELNDSSIRPANLVALASFSAGPEMPPESFMTREHHAFDDAWVNYHWAKQNRKAMGNDGIKIVHTFTVQPSH